MTEYDLLLTDWRRVADSIVLEVKTPKIEFDDSDEQRELNDEAFDNYISSQEPEGDL